jgi:hypothetical protein
VTASLPEQNFTHLAEPMPDVVIPEAESAVPDRGFLFGVAFGIALAVTALLALPWPPFGGPILGGTASHLPRLRDATLTPNGFSAPGLLEATPYLAIFAALWFLVAAWREGSQRAYVGLLASAGLGLFYAMQFVLQSVGAMANTCGFAVVAAIAGLALSMLFPKSQPERLEENEYPAEEAGNADPQSPDVATEHPEHNGSQENS